MRHAVHHVRVANGLRLQYVDHGAPDGTPVVFLHGLTDSLESFAPLLECLPPWLRAIVPSQRGHGSSARPDSGYTPSDFARDVAHLLDALEIERAFIAGHSMGSMAAQRFALDFPDRTLGLVLLASWTTLKGSAAVEELWADVVALEDPIDPAFARAFQLSTLAQPVDPEFLETVVRESCKVPARVWRAALLPLLRTDHSVELAAIRVPTLVLWGDRDEISPRADQERLASLIPDARLIVYEGAGHALHWEEPERSARDIASFVGGHTKGSATRAAEGDPARARQGVQFSSEWCR